MTKSDHFPVKMTEIWIFVLNKDSHFGPFSMEQLKKYSSSLKNIQQNPK